MRGKIENSIELRDRILSDEKLLRDLSERIAEILKGKVEIREDETYTFVALVYKKPVFAPEIFVGPVGGWRTRSSRGGHGHQCHFRGYINLNSCGS